MSQLHPYIISASQTFPSYTYTVPSPASCTEAKYAMLWQRPWFMQFLGHVLRPQACPSKPVSHTQTPSKRSQYPLFEHSAGAWASSVPFALSDQAGPSGHSMRLQSAPVHPVLQLHCRAEVEPSFEDSHEPCPLQRFGEHGWDATMLARKLKSVTTTATAILAAS